MCRKPGSQPKRAKAPMWRFSGGAYCEYLEDGWNQPDFATDPIVNYTKISSLFLSLNCN